MGDPQTDRRAGASHAALMAELSCLRDLLAKRDNRLAEQDERLAELTGLIRDLRDEIRLLKNLPRRPELKPSGLAATVPASDRPSTLIALDGSEFVSSYAINCPNCSTCTR